MHKNVDDTIFVSIAAYRDPELVPTLLDMFAKANAPENLHVGICWQYLEGEFPAPETQIPFSDQCQFIKIPADETEGTCWARHQVQTLYQDEKFYFQIDSHMRFVEGWDSILIHMLNQCPAEKPFLSSYPPGYTLPDNFDPPHFTEMFPLGFTSGGMVYFKGYISPISEAPETPIENPFVAAGFFFCEGKVVQEVPYDPHLYFDGEEITLSARLWTNGWMGYSPNAVVVYHLYNTDVTRSTWTNREFRGKREALSMKRARYLLGEQFAVSSDALMEIDKFGLGTYRTLKSFESYCGLDFKTRLMWQRSNCHPYKTDPNRDTNRLRMAEVFEEIYQDRVWSSGETRCGPGSTEQAVRPLLQELLGWLHQNKVKSICDAGCGDLNWTRFLASAVDHLIGVDISSYALTSAKERSKEFVNVSVKNLDITSVPCPQVDLVLCRDVLTHLPGYLVHSAIQKFVESGASYLAATSFKRPTGVNTDIVTGGWRPLELFSFNRTHS